MQGSQSSSKLGELKDARCMQVDPKAVQSLRKESGAGMMDCKKVRLAGLQPSPSAAGAC